MTKPSPAQKPPDPPAAKGRASVVPLGDDTPAALRCHDLEVRYEGCREAALSGVHLTVRPGERIALIGPSGGGKTTLLRALEGSVAPTHGSIRREGQVALIYQDLRLVTQRTVLQNVADGALGRSGRIGGILRIPADVRAHAEELLNELGLRDLAHQRVAALSGGQRQRVAIARALCAKPAVLLADEPLSALDPANARRVLEMLTRLQDRFGFALLISVHNAPVDPDWFDRAVRVEQGRSELLEPEEFAEEVAARAAPIAPEVPAQDQSAPVRSGALADDLPALPPRGAGRYALPALGVLGAVVVTGWALAGLETRGITPAGALEGLAAFAQALLPGEGQTLASLPWATLFTSLVETIRMAVIGTAAGVALSLPLAVLACARTSLPGLRHAVRFVLNLIRTIPAIIWGLIFVAAVGLGPIAGVLALAMYSTGYLSKFFYEALENADDRPARALQALGASRAQSFFSALLPEARAALAGACLFVFEYNVRSASILGVVGAGGIGQDLMYYIEWRDFPAAAAGLLLVLVVVVALDAVSEAWRRRMVRRAGV